MSPTNSIEVFNVINSLANTTSTGEDEIPVKLLKFVAHEISDPLTDIINKTVIEATFPDKLKIAEIKPIHKKV